MKKILLLITISLTAFGGSTQDYKSLKTLVTFNKYEQAKTDFDKAITNAKFAGKAEAYILKTIIYAGLGSQNTPDSSKLLMESATAFRKYLEMDPEMTLTDLIYQEGPVMLYNSLFNRGLSDYNEKKWEQGFLKFNEAYDVSNALIKLKILNTAYDTSLMNLAAFTAEKANKKDEAAIYYKKLADINVSGENYDNVYRFLVRYSFEKKNMTDFDKYKKIGAEYYPKNDFFTYDKVDFAFGLAEGFENKKKALDEVLASDPTNYKANQFIGEIIYDTLNSDKEGAVMPANAADLEKTMVSSFLKAATAKPESEISYLYVGDHFIHKASKINDARSAHVADMKNRTKPGTMASKEDVAKRDQLDAQYGEELEKAKEPYEKTAAIFAARAKANSGLELRDKEQYKKAVNYLSEIAMFKRIQSKGKPADVTKYTAEEKKWNELYDTINAIPTIMKEK